MKKWYIDDIEDGIAEQVAKELGEDGQDWSRWDEVLKNYPHQTEQRGRSIWRIVFLDGSALVATEAFWETEEGFLSQTHILDALRDTGKVRSEDLYEFAWDWLEFAEDHEVDDDEFVLEVMTAHAKGLSAEEWKKDKFARSGLGYAAGGRGDYGEVLDAAEDLLRSQGLWPWDPNS